MESLFVLNWILKNPTLKRAEIQIQKYPEDVINSEEDLKKTRQENPKSLEEYLFGEVWGTLTSKFYKKFHAIGVQNLNSNKISVAYAQDVQINEILEVLKQLGIEANVIEESEIKGKLGFYRF